MGIVEILVAIVVILIALWAVTLAMRIGAGWAGVPKGKNTIMRALLAMFLSWLVIGFFGGAGSFVPGFGNIIGLLIGLALNGVVVAGVYGEKFMKGVQIYILALIAQVLLVVLIVFLLAMFGVALT